MESNGPRPKQSPLVIGLSGQVALLLQQTDETEALRMNGMMTVRRFLEAHRAELNRSRWQVPCLKRRGRDRRPFDALSNSSGT